MRSKMWVRKSLTRDSPGSFSYRARIAFVPRSIAHSPTDEPLAEPHSPAAPALAFAVVQLAIVFVSRSLAKL